MSVRDSATHQPEASARRFVERLADASGWCRGFAHGRLASAGAPSRRRKIIATAAGCEYSAGNPVDANDTNGFSYPEAAPMMLPLFPLRWATLMLAGVLCLVLAGCGPSKLTKENYDKIQNDMTLAQVAEILGSGTKQA